MKYHTSKYIRRYGITSYEMAKKLKISHSSLRRYMNIPEKKKIILKILKIKEKEDILA